MHEIRMISKTSFGSLFLYLLGVQAQFDSKAVYETPDVYPSPNTTGAGGWAKAFEKAREFVDKLTLDEKAGLVTGTLGPCDGNIAPIPRLGFGGLCIQDGPLSVRVADFASVFPAGLTVAATWNKDLALRRGIQLGSEFRAKGAHVALGPSVGPLGRNPLGGRNWEGFSPDPYLSGELVAETIKGMQSSGVQACVKHYIGYEQSTGQNPSQTESGKVIEGYSSNIDDRTIHELYAWPFANAIRAGASSVMCSYNRVNSTYACENSKALNGMLKEELGFQGWVVSDWGGTMSGVNAVNSGLDMEQPGVGKLLGGRPYNFGDHLTNATKNGTLEVSRLDDMAKRVLTPFFYLRQDAANYPQIDPSTAELNMFDQSSSNFTWRIGGEAHRDVRGDHAKLIRKIGAAVVTLLKNKNNTLPIKEPPKVIGVFGNDAADLTQGLYQPPNNFDIGTLAVGGGSGSGRLSYVVSPLEAIKAWAKPANSLVQYITDNSQILAETGGGFSTGGILGSIYPIPDVCFVFLKYFVSEGPDHSDFDLNNNGSAVIRKVAGSCPNTIVVTHSGSPNLMPWADHENVTAILLAHLPGEQSGNAVVDVITGKYNPSSKLPFTIAYNESDYNTKITNFTAMNITDTNGQQIDFTEGLSIDYRNFDSQGIEPRYEFGFGLSYTTFNITSMQVRKRSKRISAHPPAQIGTTPGSNPALWDELVDLNFTIQNTGSLTGTAIPQLYLSYPVGASDFDTPVQVLRGFDSIKTPASGSKTVRLSLRRRDLSRWDVAAQDWKIPTGEFTLKLGMSSRDIHQMKTVKVI